MSQQQQQQQETMKEANPEVLAISNKSKKINKGGKGKPAGLKDESNWLPPSGKWPSNQRCVQLVQTLTKLGRYIELHKTGAPKKQPKQLPSDKQLTQDQQYEEVVQNEITKANEKEKDKLNNIELVRIFANWSNIGLNEARNQACFVYFFEIRPKLIEFTHDYQPIFPEVDLSSIELLPDVYKQTITRIASLITPTFIKQLSDMISQYIEYISQYPDFIHTAVQNIARTILEDAKNVQVCDANIILQAIFMRHLISNKISYNVQIKAEQSKIVQNMYSQYIRLESSVLELAEEIQGIMNCFEVQAEPI